jgi:predicted dehydrogenase
MRIAVCGFRHGHISSLVKELKECSRVEIVAAAEPNPDLAADFIKAAGVPVTHASLDAMLKEVEFDALVFGDVYGDRGDQVIKGLEAGKHILADKPLCTQPGQMRRIRALAGEKKRSVMVALTLRYVPSWQTARRLILEGAIGEVCTGTVHGQHPLSYKAGRPAWYFEAGRHGGTVNDIMVHGIDSMKFMTGHAVIEAVGARAWHMEPAEVPFFQDCAQALLRLDNQAGIMMETSYKTPKGHSAPWHAVFFGTLGSLSVDTGKTLTLCRAGEPARSIPAAATFSAKNCVEDLIHEVEGLPGHQPVLTTAESLDASEKAVLIQQAADQGKAYLKV